jgi:hypothetical protein
MNFWKIKGARHDSACLWSQHSEVEAGESRVQVQPELCSKILSQINKQKKEVKRMVRVALSWNKIFLGGFCFLYLPFHLEKTLGALPGSFGPSPVCGKSRTVCEGLLHVVCLCDHPEICDSASLAALQLQGLVRGSRHLPIFISFCSHGLLQVWVFHFSGVHPPTIP